MKTARDLPVDCAAQRRLERAKAGKAINPPSASALRCHGPRCTFRAGWIWGDAALAEIVQFVSARERELRAFAEEIIESLGPEAGLRLGRLARSPALPEDARERLLAVAEIIEREQGHGWYFPGDEERGLV